jgi:hypothetical protein
VSEKEKEYRVALRCVTVNGTLCVSLDDVVGMIRTIGLTEDLDVRKRMNLLADDLLKAATK